MIQGLPDGLPANPAYSTYSKGIGKGWYSLVLDLHRFLIRLDPRYTVDQVKEKFGTLRYYYTPSVDFDSPEGKTMEQLVRFAETISARTCETCGNPGEIRDSYAWAVTVCDACYGAKDSDSSGDVSDPS